jgi:hypothetical protein
MSSVKPGATLLITGTGLALLAPTLRRQMLVEVFTKIIEKVASKSA